MSLHVPLTVHGFTIDVHVFVDEPGSEEKARDLAPFLERMPRSHVESGLTRFAIFVIREQPALGAGGATYLPGRVDDAFRGKFGITGVADTDLDLVRDPERGVLGIPLDRWQRPLSSLKFTVLHEAGHAVHSSRMSLISTGASLDDFLGVRPTCGHGNAVVRRATEAYARYILGASLCRDAVVGQTTEECNARVLRHLRASPAFRSIPSGWRPGRR